MTDEPPLTIMPDTKGWQRIVANQRQALYEKEQELDRLRAELLAAAGALDDAGDYAKNDEVASSVRLYQARDRARRAAATEGV